MRVGRTTRCCAIVAIIIAAWSLPIVAQTIKKKSDRTPLMLFPVRTLWTLSLGGQLTSPPAYAGSHAYFAIEGDQVVAYDLATGAQEWTAPVTPKLALTAGDGLLFVVEPTGLTALRADDGSVAWRFPLTTELAVPPAWDNGWLVLATVDGEIVALRAVDGYPIWHRDLKTRARVQPSLAADRLYVAVDDGRIMALRVDTGASVWESRVEGTPTSLLALDDRLFVGSTDNFFYCLLAASGKWDWRWRTGADIIGVPVVDNRNVYFVSLDNVLRALSKKTGGQQWARRLPLRPTRGPVKAGPVLVVTGLAPSLLAYRLDDGTPAGEMATSGELAAATYAPPDMSLPTLLLVSRDLAQGATVSLIVRQLEPPPTPLLPLPNPVKLEPLPVTEPQ